MLTWTALHFGPFLFERAFAMSGKVQVPQQSPMGKAAHPAVAKLDEMMQVAANTTTRIDYVMSDVDKPTYLNKKLVKQQAKLFQMEMRLGTKDSKIKSLQKKLDDAKSSVEAAAVDLEEQRQENQRAKERISELETSVKSNLADRTAFTTELREIGKMLGVGFGGLFAGVMKEEDLLRDIKAKVKELKKN